MSADPSKSPPGYTVVAEGAAPEVGDFIYWPRLGRLERVDDASEDGLLQSEFYTSIHNSGGLHVRPVKS